MDMEIVVSGIVFIVILVMSFFAYRYYSSLPPVVTQEYKCQSGDFKVKGRMNSFVIKKDDSLEFLVEEGEIVALRDINKSKEFTYYKEMK